MVISFLIAENTEAFSVCPSGRASSSVLLWGTREAGFSPPSLPSHRTPCLVLPTTLPSLLSPPRTTGERDVACCSDPCTAQHSSPSLWVSCEWSSSKVFTPITVPISSFWGAVNFLYCTQGSPFPTQPPPRPSAYSSHSPPQGEPWETFASQPALHLATPWFLLT